MLYLVMMFGIFLLSSIGLADLGVPVKYVIITATILGIVGFMLIVSGRNLSKSNRGRNAVQKRTDVQWFS